MEGDEKGVCAAHSLLVGNFRTLQHSVGQTYNLLRKQGDEQAKTATELAVVSSHVTDLTAQLLNWQEEFGAQQASRDAELLHALKRKRWSPAQIVILATALITAASSIGVAYIQKEPKAVAVIRSSDAHNN